MGGVSWAAVLTLLDWKWSPQQIAGTLKRVFPDEPERHVSHETIYTAIYAQPRGELRRQLIACLRPRFYVPQAVAGGYRLSWDAGLLWSAFERLHHRHGLPALLYALA